MIRLLATTGIRRGEALALTWKDWNREKGELRIDATLLYHVAAGPALRRALGSHWRGATVRICSLQRCITTRLGDYCVCRPSTIIDLSWRAFSDRRIGLGVPLWRGVVRVTVSRA